jgi:branched-chain amino acid transport system substrate-binding protein
MTVMYSKRRFTRGNKAVEAILISLLFLLGTGSVIAQEKPIKIGVISSLTGPAAPDAKDVVNAIQMCVDEAKGIVAGRPIKLIIEDDGMKPPMGLAKARKLIMEDGVHALTGVLLGSVNGAVAPYTNEQKVPLLTMASSPTELTYKKDMPYFFRLVAAGTQLSHPFGDWVYKKVEVRQVVTLSLDYTYGHDSVSAFQRTFEEAGGRVIQKIWIPMNVLDFAPYISQINRTADGIFLVITGSNALRFSKQFEEAGLKGKMKALCGPSVTAESLLHSMGDEVLGYCSVSNWSAALQTSEAQRFVKEFRKRFGNTPSLYAESGYSSTMWLLEAIRAAKGNVEDKAKFVEVLKNTKVNKSPRGPIEVDEFNCAVLNAYVTKVERVGGELQNTVIDTIPMVNQFWKYNPDVFRKETLYSRDYPPCRYCK